MQAVTYLAPALAPLAIKLIDKYVFNDDRPPVPQIIQIPAPLHCACCENSTEGYVKDRTCSTCALKSSTYRPSDHRLSTKSTLRSSSTSSAYDGEKSKSCNHRSRRSSGSTTQSVKQSDKKYTPGKTLDILAGNLKREITKQGKATASSNFASKSGSSGHSSRSKSLKTDTGSSSGLQTYHDRKSSDHESRKSSQTSNRKSCGSKISKS